MDPGGGRPDEGAAPSDCPSAGHGDGQAREADSHKSPTLPGSLCGRARASSGPMGRGIVDPLSWQASVLTSAAESVTGSVSSLSAEFARQNAELMASRLARGSR